MAEPFIPPLLFLLVKALATYAMQVTAWREGYYLLMLAFQM